MIDFSPLAPGVWLWLAFLKAETASPQERALLKAFYIWEDEQGYEAASLAIQIATEMFMLLD